MTNPSSVRGRYRVGWRFPFLAQQEVAQAAEDLIEFSLTAEGSATLHGFDAHRNAAVPGELPHFHQRANFLTTPFIDKWIVR